MDNNFYYTFNGYIIHNLCEIPKNAIVTANPRLLGGKGGFGSMLRAIGSQIEKTTNREMCRDLSGRRMRDVNNEKKFKEWLDKADDRERAKIELYLEKRRKRKVLLEQGPSATVPFQERTSNDKRQQIASELQDAIEEAFEKQNKKSEISNKVKNKKYNMGIDSDVDSSSSSSCPSPIRDKEPEIVNQPTEILHDNIVMVVESEKSEDECPNPNDSHNPEVIDNVDEEPPLKKLRTEDSACEKKEIKKVTEYPAIDLDECGSVTSLLTFDTDWIKHDLVRRGLKCGGTLMERAQRLFAVKGLDSQEYPASLLAGAINKRRNK